ncbi:MAG: hypothetical protein AB7H70_14325 [Rhodospirillaceae bacterium]
MTTAITVRPLSGSTDGRGIKVAATATPGTLIHTAQASVTDMDVVEVAVCNTSSSDVEVSFECWGTTSPDDIVKRTIPAGDTVQVPVPPGRNGLALRAFAATGNVLSVFGSVKRIAVT